MFKKWQNFYVKTNKTMKNYVLIIFIACILLSQFSVVYSCTQGSVMADEFAFESTDCLHRFQQNPF